MKSRGKAQIFMKQNECHVRILKSYHENFYDIITKWSKSEQKYDFNLEIGLTGTLEKFESGGVFRFKLKETPTFSMQKEHTFSTRNQMNTLRGIERFIAWAQLGYRPKEEDMYWIHEEIIHHASKWIENPVTNMKEPMRTSDPRMDSRTMSFLIQYAMDLLAVQDIPREVLSNIGDDLMSLWDTWYKWRYSLGVDDPIFESEKDCTWEKYKENHPVCELCGQPEKENDALERAHIVSVGSRTDLFNKSWNWIRIHHSHHHAMHADKDGTFIGWDNIIASYPFIEGKINRAKELANKE